MNVAAGRSAVRLSVSALECLRRHPWPGNVRELGNLIERLSILSAGRLVSAADLPPRYRPRDWTPEPGADLVPALQPVEAPALPQPEQSADAETGISEREALMLLEEPEAASGTSLPPGGIDLRAHVASIEESLIRQALERSGGVVAQAARLLNLRRTTLVERLRKFEITACDESSED